MNLPTTPPRTLVVTLASVCVLSLAHADVDTAKPFSPHTTGGQVGTLHATNRLEAPLVGDPVARFPNTPATRPAPTHTPVLSDPQGQDVADKLAIPTASEPLRSMDAKATQRPLHVRAGTRLSIALGEWLQARDMNMSWEASGSLPGRMRDVVFERDWSASDTDLVKTLTQVLEPFALNAQIVQSSNSVVIRNRSLATTPPSAHTPQ